MWLKVHVDDLFTSHVMGWMSITLNWIGGKLFPTNIMQLLIFLEKRNNYNTKINNKKTLLTTTTNTKDNPNIVSFSPVMEEKKS